MYLFYSLFLNIIYIPKIYQTLNNKHFISIIELHIKYISLALEQAKLAFKANEVPIGCVIVKNNEVIVAQYNQTEKNNSSLQHAEIRCIQKACCTLNYKHLLNTQIYSTIEPCTMCMGAIANARISKLIFGAFESKMGYLSIHNKIDDKILVLNNHKFKVVSKVLETECAKLMSDFFKIKRNH